jgi:hypothetical protein
MESVVFWHWVLGMVEVCSGAGFLNVGMGAGATCLGRRTKSREVMVGWCRRRYGGLGRAQGLAGRRERLRGSREDPPVVDGTPVNRRWSLRPGCPGSGSPNRPNGSEIRIGLGGSSLVTQVPPYEPLRPNYSR